MAKNTEDKSKVIDLVGGSSSWAAKLMKSNLQQELQKFDKVESKKFKI